MSGGGAWTVSGCGRVSSYSLRKKKMNSIGSKKYFPKSCVGFFRKMSKSIPNFSKSSLQNFPTVYLCSFAQKNEPHAWWGSRLVSPTRGGVPRVWDSVRVPHVCPLTCGGLGLLWARSEIRPKNG